MHNVMLIIVIASPNHVKKSVIAIFVILCALATALAYTGYLLYKFITTRTAAKTTGITHVARVPIYTTGGAHKLGSEEIAKLKKLISNILNMSIYPGSSVIIHSEYQIISIQIRIAATMMPITMTVLEELRNVTFGYSKQLNVTYVSIPQGVVTMNYLLTHFEVEFRNFSELSKVLSNNTILICMRGNISITTPARTGKLHVAFCNVTRISKMQPELNIKGVRNIVKTLLSRIYVASNVTGIGYKNGTECLIYKGTLNLSKVLRSVEASLYNNVENIYIRVRLKQILEHTLALWRYEIRICVQNTTNHYPLTIQMLLSNVNRTIIGIDIHYSGVINSVEVNKVNRRLIMELIRLPRENMSGLERLLEEMLIKSPTVI